MADHFPFELRRATTIAVMGLPYTFRQEMGDYISKWAKCPNLTFEVILKASLPNTNLREEQGQGGAVNGNDVAFNILCETALSLLDISGYHPNCVVINFPIPTKPQLEKLISLHLRPTEPQLGRPINRDDDSRQRRLVIIECQRRNQFRWRWAVEDPSRGIEWNPRYSTGNKEPGKWEDVEKAIQQQQEEEGGLDATLARHHLYVKKLVVDPFEDLRSRDFTISEGLERGSLFAQAIKNRLACDDLKYRKLRVNLDYSVWRREWLERQSRRGTRNSTSHVLCKPGDCILRFTDNLKAGEGDPICEACRKKLTEGQAEGAYYYYCQLCSLSLHELCAVAQSPTANTTAYNRPTRSHVVEYYSRAWASVLSPANRNIKTACYSCKRVGKSFSEEWRCDACVYTAHLKAQLLPTAFKHSCDEHHILSLRLSWQKIQGSGYDCKACGLRGAYSSYSCNICNSEYHLECVLDMPLQTKGNPQHGGHTHNMEIQFCCGEKEDEYEWCPVCYDDIDPDTWVYTCQAQHCDFVAHLYCISPSHTFEWYKMMSITHLRSVPLYIRRVPLYIPRRIRLQRLW